MGLPALFLTSLLVGFSGAIVPGPLLTLTIGRAIKQGALAGPLVAFGHGCLEIITVIGIVFGLGNFLQRQPVANAIGIFGGLVLLWMGFGMVRSWKSVSFSAAEGEESEKSGAVAGSVVAGVVGSLSNPYWFLWWATIGAAFITEALKFGKTGVAVFFTGHILSDILWFSAVSAALAVGRKVFSDRVYKLVFLFCGLFLLLLAVLFLWAGLSGNVSV